MNKQCLFYADERNCKQKDTSECTDWCNKYLLYDALRKQSNMPKRFQRNFSWNYPKDNPIAYGIMRRLAENIINMVDTGNGVYLWSNQVGTGKTTLATTIGNTYMETQWDKAYLEPITVYVVIPEFLERIKQSWSHPDDELSTLLYNLETVPLVIWDDIGSEKPSDWVRERLYTCINRRYTEELSNIFTSNLSPQQLEQRLGKRIVSRIEGMCEVIELDGRDLRRE